MIRFATLKILLHLQIRFCIIKILSWAAAFRAANCWWNYNTILGTCVAREHLFGSETLHKNLVHTCFWRRQSRRRRHVIMLTVSLVCQIRCLLLPDRTATYLIFRFSFLNIIQCNNLKSATRSQRVCTCGLLQISICRTVSSRQLLSNNFCLS